MTTGMWGQKKELSQARTYIKSGKDYDKAEKLMKDLVKNPENRTNAKIYATWYDAVAGQYAQANEKLYLKPLQSHRLNTVSMLFLLWKMALLFLKFLQ